MSECIFCKIAQGDEEAKKIYESDDVVAFLDIKPRSPGHTLVIPKKHVEFLTDLDDELLSEVFKAVKKVENMLKTALNPDAFNVGINDGKDAGQVIPHLHVNIFPRFEGDEGGPVHLVVNNPPSESISEMAKRIRGLQKALSILSTEIYNKNRNFPLW